ncbi:factor-independent urate hydroxylase [Muricoccus radiodurans]|uniref:factor-independent urate hydroxylase n=1 Tax=Muricoccus radiodurans TaxID=2231721 RepID=UPI003CE956FA
MPLISNTHGKGRVRTLRIAKHPDGTQSVRELNCHVMLEGDFGRSFSAADNSRTLSTDTMKNLINIVAKEHPDTPNEPFLQAVCRRFLERYETIGTVSITAHETRWTRMVVNGAPAAHAFTLDGNGRPVAKVTATRAGMDTESGVAGLTFLKSTASGWANFWQDSYTTIPPTDDRIAATALDARWTWTGAPADYEAANATILQTMLGVFAETYSHSMQDSLYRMAEAALAKVTEIGQVSLAAPNKHYLLVNLAPFGLTNENEVFLPTDEPHGQIECVVGRAAPP